MPLVSPVSVYDVVGRGADQRRAAVDAVGGRRRDGVHVSATCALPGVAASPVGATGAGAIGVAETADDAADDAAPLTATTV